MIAFNGMRDNPMRVATLTASISRRAGGLFHSVRRLNAAVVGRGMDICVFALRDSFTEKDTEAWKHIPIKTCRICGPQAFGFAPQLRRELSRWSPELIHLHGVWMYPSAVALGMADGGVRPSVISPRGMLDPWALRNSGWKKKIAGWVYENRNLRSAACIHALCESEYRSIRAYGLKNPVAVIPNGIDLPEDGPKLCPPWPDRLRPGRRVLLFLGRIHPKKGLSNLIETWARLSAEKRALTEEWALVIAGWSQGGHEDKLKRIVNAKGLERDIMFLGPAFDDVKKACLQNADAFVLPSFSEGLPMSVLEAWSYSLPVMMTGECNTPEGFCAKAAVEVRPEQDSLVEGLDTLMSMSDVDRGQMGLRGRRLVETSFDWPQIAAQMIDVYRWVLGQGPKPDCVRLD